METQTKTVREWFEELPEPYRSQAIANTYEEKLDEFADSLAKAISGSFVCSETSQGHKYWKKIYKELLKNPVNLNKNKPESDKKAEKNMEQKITLEQLAEALTMLTKEVSKLKRLLIEKKEKPSTEEPDYLLTIKEAANFFKISLAYIYSKILNKELKVMNRGKRMYISYNELLKHVNQERKISNSEIDTCCSCSKKLTDIEKDSGLCDDCGYEFAR